MNYAPLAITRSSGEHPVPKSWIMHAWRLCLYGSNFTGETGRPLPSNSSHTSWHPRPKFEISPSVSTGQRNHGEAAPQMMIILPAAVFCWACPGLRLGLNAGPTPALLPRPATTSASQEQGPIASVLIKTWATKNVRKVDAAKISEDDLCGPSSNSSHQHPGVVRSGERGVVAQHPHGSSAV